jgi:ATP-dependent RNA helicase MSS116, mitochondrial
MGFRADIDAITDYFPKTPIRQTFLFSATVSPAIRQVAREVLDKDHHFIDVVPKDSSPVHAHIPQFHTVLPSAKEQLPHLFRIIMHDQLANPGSSKIMVFLNTTKQTQLFTTVLRELSKKILPSRPQVYEIHSKRTQAARTGASNAFRNDRSGAAVLVTSDVSARGVDYPGVTRVIQVGSPLSTEQYVHRVGRTGRAGKGGRVDLLLLPFEQNFVRYQLSDMPIKELTHDQLLNETNSLCEAFESDPAAYWNNVKAAKPSGRESTTRNHNFRNNNPVTALASLETETSALLDQVDRDAIREVFISLLGYYFVKASDMRVTRQKIYEGLQAWTTEACGLPNAPFVSDALLAKMGGLNDRQSARGPQRGPLRKSFGLKPSATRYTSSEQNRQRNEWTNRDSSRSRPWQRRGDDEHENARSGSRRMGRGSRSGREGERQRDGEHENARFGSRFSGRGSRSGQEGEYQRDGEWLKPGRSRRDRGDEPPF